MSGHIPSGLTYRGHGNTYVVEKTIPRAKTNKYKAQIEVERTWGPLKYAKYRRELEDLDKSVERFLQPDQLEQVHDDLFNKYNTDT